MMKMMKTPMKTIEEFVSDKDFAIKIMENYIVKQEKLMTIIQGVNVKTECNYRDDNCDYISCDYCDKQGDK